MTTYWVSWVSGNYADEGCTKPPFKFWVSGYVERFNHGLSEKEHAKYLKIKTEKKQEEFIDKNGRDDCTICATITAESEDEIWQIIAKYFPDYRQRFCEVREDGFVPSDRFQ